MKVTVLDMQPIEPATGGGRLRLLGLYHGLGEGVQTKYIGTFDWRGPGFRQHMLSSTLEEVDIPLTEKHFEAADKAKSKAGNCVVIDSLFADQAHFSPDYVSAAREAVRGASAVVFSHPWIFPIVQDALDPAHQLIVYDSHNVEGVLRQRLLGGNDYGAQIVRRVVEIEQSLCSAADLVLACSQSDRLLFGRLYGTPIEKIKVVPNGVFTSQIKPAALAQKQSARERLKLDSRIAGIFLGSNYDPNIEAAAFITQNLAPALPSVNFVIAGSVGEGLTAAFGSKLPENVRVTGFIDETSKLDWLAACDIAINPMFSGSGTNIKMFDFMAAGLPIVSTPVGARGIETGQRAFLTSDGPSFAKTVQTLASDRGLQAEIGKAARTEAERHYSWEIISSNLGKLLHHHFKGKTKESSSPSFTVVIPTFNRHCQLTRLLDCLAMQTERDFEVIVIDQSEDVWPGARLNFGIDILYCRSSVRGAVSARNLGALLSRGKVLAFTDDDCEPPAGWLEAAGKLLDRPEVVGVEGLVVSAKYNNPSWRPVTNRGISGLGFMTANLFVKADAFNQVGGFDVSFENPHFREDTDLGWRLQEIGELPFSEEAWLFHPPHPRTVERESRATRDTFFEKDALLLAKHPIRYRELFFFESQWLDTPGFWPNLMRGMEKYKVEVPDYIKQQSLGPS